MLNRIPQFQPLNNIFYGISVEEQIKYGFWGPGETTKQFENMLSFITTNKYVLSTTSGTTALLIAIKSLGLEKGATIAFPSYTFLAGANAAKFLDYNIKLIDIKEETLSMDPDLLRIELDRNKSIQVVIFVNHNGYNGEDKEEIKNICDEFNVFMIEDSSQCIGIPNTSISGDLSILSFSVPKLVTTAQGGAVMTNNKILYNKCLEIQDHGANNWRKDRIHKAIGVNFKFNDILASFGLSQLNILNELLLKRKQLWDWYREEIKLFDFGMESNWMVIYKSNLVDEIIDKLEENNIQAVRYYKPINHNLIFQDGEQYPIAENIYENVVYLPSSLTLTKEQVKTICNIIKEVEK